MIPLNVLLTFWELMSLLGKLNSLVFIFQSILMSTKGKNTIQVGDKTLKFAKACIAAGGRAAVPPIPGLNGNNIWAENLSLIDVGFLTNANIFNLTELPKRLAVIGTLKLEKFLF
jgi:pyruvate/2-oxoglutarate dehydrogenase complex dihydrolipoamide dehydrogenase (E3) component